MSSTHTTWQGAVARSNKKEQARVAKKYPGASKKVSADVMKGGDTSFADESSPFLDEDPMLSLAPSRSHDAKQYAKASGMPLSKAKKLLKETDTLQK